MKIPIFPGKYHEKNVDFPAGYVSLQEVTLFSNSFLSGISLLTSAHFRYHEGGHTLVSIGNSGAVPWRRGRGSRGSRVRCVVCLFSCWGQAPKK